MSDPLTDRDLVTHEVGIGQPPIDGATEAKVAAFPGMGAAGTGRTAFYFTSGRR